MYTSSPTVPDELVIQTVLKDQHPTDDRDTSTQREFRAALQREIQSVLNAIGNTELAEITGNIFNELVRFFDWLLRIDNNLHQLDTLRESLSLLEVLGMEAHFLVDFIETKAMPSKSVNDALREMLDGIVYSITHDLRRIFEQELINSGSEQSIPVVYGKILHAHGLLSNCFQQATITLLQSFDRSIDVSSLFNDAEMRLKQSLVLCRDLSSLLRFVRHAEKQTDPDILRKLVARILAFRDGSMQYLMYKDWRGYETLALQIVTSIENNLDAQPLLQQFACYLEVLYGHVKMRAVLTNIFPYSGNDDQV